MEQYYIEPISGKKSESEEELRSLIKNKTVHGLITYVMIEDPVSMECVKDEDLNIIHLNIIIDKKIPGRNKLEGIVTETLPAVLSVEDTVYNLSGNEKEYLFSSFVLSSRRSVKHVDTQELCSRVFQALTLSLN